MLYIGLSLKLSPLKIFLDKVPKSSPDQVTRRVALDVFMEDENALKAA